MSTVTVSIGRNLPAGGRLSDHVWGRFIARTQAVVLLACDSFNAVHFTGTGTGWFEGQAEESFTIIATIDDALLPELAARLAILARVFGQDSIALTAGTTTLVEAAK